MAQIVTQSSQAHVAYFTICYIQVGLSFLKYLHLELSQVGCTYTVLETLVGA